jgi:hypothetical protein
MKSLRLLGAELEGWGCSQRKTTGKEFVDHFGEPSKKSAGEPGYVPPFLEWNSIGSPADFLLGSPKWSTNSLPVVLGPTSNVLFLSKAGEPGYVPPFLEWNSIDIVDGDGTVLPVGILIELREPIAPSFSGTNSFKLDHVHDPARSQTVAPVSVRAPPIPSVTPGSRNSIKIPTGNTRS